jgi:hypothetical protein
LYRLTEKLLPYGRRFKEDVAYVKAFGERLVRSMTERIKAEEEGKADPEGLDDSSEKSAGQQGLLLRELVKEYGKDDDYSFLADACLNFLTAGKHIHLGSPLSANCALRQGHDSAGACLDHIRDSS